MPNIRVTCPTCQTQLEIDSVHEGQEVECGNCLQVFVASTAKPRPPAPDAGSGGGGRVRGSSSRPSRAARDRDDDEDDRDRGRGRGRSRRRDADDDDDFDYDPRSERSGGSNALAVTSLILGIVSLVPGCCCLFVSVPTALGAIVTGSLGLKNREGKGMAIAGLVLGGVSLGFVVLSFALNFGGWALNPGMFR